ncbi:MAG: VOC family protein [Bacteroidia bacterium]
MSKYTPKKQSVPHSAQLSGSDSIPEYKDFITWFEIPANNFDRACKFYSFIYQFKMETSEMNGLTMAFFPSSTGIGGAIISGTGSVPGDKGPLIYLNAGKDMDGMLQRIKEAGGSVLMEKTLINETAGHFALFVDTEGNKLALHAKP